MAKLLPVLLALLGLGGGVGAGFVLRPASATLPQIAHETAPCGDPSAGPDVTKTAKRDSASTDEAESEGVFVKLENQFVIPLIAGGEVAAMVVMNITLEVDPGTDTRVLKREPRIRDRFLRVMLDHAATGGFDGVFTSNGQIERLKSALSETAAQEIGAGLRDVLILDLNKQAV